MDSPGWAVLDILEHPIGKVHWEGLNCSQGAHLCLPGAVIALQGVSPEPAQGCSPHPVRASPDTHNARLWAVLQNSQPPAPPQSSPSTTMALAHIVCPRETQMGRI